MNHGGRIAMLGLPAEPFAVDWARIVTHMITLKGIYGREMFETWYAMSAMLRSGLDLSAVITDRFAGRGLAGRVRRGPIRARRQGRHGLEHGMTILPRGLPAALVARSSRRCSRRARPP